MKTNKQQETWKLKIAKAIVKYAPYAITALWRLMILAAKGICWFLMPLAALIFAQYFTAGMNLNTEFGVLAAIATYVVAVVAGIKGAIQASRHFDEYKNVNLIRRVDI